MFTCVICEDEEAQRKIIISYLKQIFKELPVTYEILEFETGEELIQYYPTQAELIFLDIQMGELSGIDTAKRIRTFNEDVEIILITGLLEYMQEGYEVNAKRYLVKPVQYDDFTRQVRPCIEKLLNKKENYIWIRSGYNEYKIRIDTIYYVETNDRKVSVYTKNKYYDTYMSMSGLEKELKKEGFFRCHKSFLINLRYVESISKDFVTIGGNQIVVSRLKMKSLREELAKIIGE